MDLVIFFQVKKIPRWTRKISFQFFFFFFKVVLILKRLQPKKLLLLIRIRIHILISNKQFWIHNTDIVMVGRNTNKQGREGPIILSAVLSFN